jgi:hypothetical protein
LSHKGHVGSSEGGVLSFQGSDSCGKSIVASLYVSDGLLKGVELTHQLLELGEYSLVSHLFFVFKMSSSCGDYGCWCFG